MARSHHRKKHREHVRQFRHSNDTEAATTSSTKAAIIVMIIGAVTGFAVGYFASDGAWLWSITGLLLGAAAGYFAGKKIDEGK